MIPEPDIRRSAHGRRAPTAATWVAGIALVGGVDQVTKAASGRLDAIPGISPVHNPRLGFELADTGRWTETALALLGVLLAAWWLVPRARTRRAVFGAVLLLGGAIGNLVDRFTLGYVRDFLAAGPVVLNLADLAVLAGLALLALSLVPRPATPPAPELLTNVDRGR